MSDHGFGPHCHGRGLEREREREREGKRKRWLQGEGDGDMCEEGGTEGSEEPLREEELGELKRLLGRWKRSGTSGAAHEEEVEEGNAKCIWGSM